MATDTSDLSAGEAPLEAKSPYELRIRREIPESEVRKALATGDMGFLHSFTTGSTLDGPGVRVVSGHLLGPGRRPAQRGQCAREGLGVGGRLAGIGGAGLGLSDPEQRLIGQARFPVRAP